MMPPTPAPEYSKETLASHIAKQAGAFGAERTGRLMKEELAGSDTRTKERKDAAAIGERVLANLKVPMLTPEQSKALDAQIASRAGLYRGRNIAAPADDKKALKINSPITNERLAQHAEDTRKGLEFVNSEAAALLNSVEQTIRNRGSAATPQEQQLMLRLKDSLLRANKLRGTYFRKRQ
jgi:hypothetical protein